MLLNNELVKEKEAATTVFHSQYSGASSQDARSLLKIALQLRSVWKTCLDKQDFSLRVLFEFCCDAIKKESDIFVFEKTKKSGKNFQVIRGLSKRVTFEIKNSQYIKQVCFIKIEEAPNQAICYLRALKFPELKELENMLQIAESKLVLGDTQRLKKPL